MMSEEQSEGVKSSSTSTTSSTKGGNSGEEFVKTSTRYRKPNFITGRINAFKLGMHFSEYADMALKHENERRAS